MAQQTHITLQLILLFAFGIIMIDARYTPMMPTVETIPSEMIQTTIGDRLNITCRVTIDLRHNGRPERISWEFKTFFLKNCTSNLRMHTGEVRDDCHQINTAESCTYEWTSEPYILDSEGEYEFACMNVEDEGSNGCEGVRLLRVKVSSPAFPSTLIPSTTTVSTITTSGTVTAPGTTYSHTSYGDGGSSNSVTTGSQFLTSNPVSPETSVERTSKDAVNTVTGSSSTSNSTSDHQVSGRKGSQLTLIVPSVVFLFIVVMAALLAMFWKKCRRRRSSDSVV